MSSTEYVALGGKASASIENILPMMVRSKSKIGGNELEFVGDIILGVVNIRFD